MALEWQTLRHRCVRAARGLGLDTLDAEDVVQEAISRLLPVLPAVTRPEAWLCTVIRNLTREKRRRRVHRARIRSQLAASAAPDRGPTSPRLETIDLRHTLLEMPPRSRSILELVLAGLTHREIAVVLRCQVHQVGPRISRALKTARRRLRCHS